ncbi:ADP-ribosylation factor GTPase-activating protein AGD4-like isoform X1 [Senna tora]|uniref:ADP-ribosylation factor GTPase-activating protein AGD4-like isoform X1 n=1 Tax=Senna tora TaxID=362788 RepID=A0A834TTK4_9FABA|nr:ADP-ribosylation factor GTPase-activating protein AGD4-like isoform X1 [Senna tora]
MTKTATTSESERNNGVGVRQAGRFPNVSEAAGIWAAIAVEIVVGLLGLETSYAAQICPEVSTSFEDLIWDKSLTLGQEEKNRPGVKDLRKSDELTDRCEKLFKGCKKFMAALGEAYNGDIAFADALEVFGGGQDDPISVSIGGPIISKFISAFRELATFKELLRSQVSPWINMLCSF